MKKLLGVLGTISLSATIGTQTIACQKKDFRLDLNTYNKDLGSFDIQLDAQMILARFNEKNDLELVLNQDVVIEKIVETKALIKAEPQSTLVTGTLEVFFEIPSLKTQPTRYIDKDGNEQSTDEKDLDELNPKIEEITQIGFYENDGEIQVVRMPVSVKKVPIKLPRQITSLNLMFRTCYLFNQDISDWSVSNVTSMIGIFAGAFNFNQDISSWDVSNVKDMASMFEGATNFNQDISSWDVSNVEGMKKMFANAFEFNNGGKPLNWGEKTKNVTNMEQMFYGAFNFNQDISSWNVSNVTDMSYMFSGAKSFNQDLSKWNAAKVEEWDDFAKNSGFEKEPEKWPLFK